MRVLFLTHRLPYAPNRGDRIRAYHTLRVLRGKASIDLVSLVHDREEAAHVGELAELADTIAAAPVPRLRNRVAGLFSLASPKPLTHTLLDSPAMDGILHHVVTDRPPDVVYAYCSGMARFALKPPLAGIPLVIDLVDVDSLKWRALAANAAPPLRWLYLREARRLSEFEAHAARRAFATLVINERENAALRTIAPDARIETVPSGVDVDYWRPSGPPSGEDEVTFCGVMNYAPNVEGVLWLVREVWPLVRRRRPRAHLSIVGANPTAAVRQIGRSDPGVTVTGAVTDVRPFLWNAAVAVAPLHVSRGLQNKALEAIASGLPLVMTSAVADGLPPDVRLASTIADDPVAFADGIVSYLAMPPPARRAKATSVDLSDLTWDRRLQSLAGLLDAARLTAESVQR